jgi:hypothetical protein
MEHGGPEWYRVSAAARECPRIGTEFLEGERSRLGAEWFRQEYLCEFVDDGKMLFTREVVEAAIDDDQQPIQKEAITSEGMRKDPRLAGARG